MRGWKKDGELIDIGHAVSKKDGELIDITPWQDSDRCPAAHLLPLLDAQGRLVFLPHNLGPLGRRYLPLTKQKGVVKQCRQWGQAAWREWNDPELYAAYERRMEAKYARYGQ
jgi:hypothetical protein